MERNVGRVRFISTSNTDKIAEKQKEIEAVQQNGGKLPYDLWRLNLIFKLSKEMGVELLNTDVPALDELLKVLSELRSDWRSANFENELITYFRNFKFLSIEELASLVYGVLCLARSRLDQRLLPADIENLKAYIAQAEMVERSYQVALQIPEFTRAKFMNPPMLEEMRTVIHDFKEKLNRRETLLSEGFETELVVFNDELKKYFSDASAQFVPLDDTLYTHSADTRLATPNGILLSTCKLLGYVLLESALIRQLKEAAKRYPNAKPKEFLSVASHRIAKYERA